MKVKAIRVSRMTGVKNNRPYDFANLTILQPADDRSWNNEAKGSSGQLQAAGFDAVDLPLEVDAYSQFHKLTFPCDVEVQTDSRVSFGEMQTYIVGLQTKAPAVAG